MKINRIDQACFKISVSPKKGEKVNIIIDPPDELRGKKAKADILLISKAGEKTGKMEDLSFLIESPGEYEVKGVFVRGLELKEGKNKNLITYTIEAEDMRILYFGDFVSKELSSGQLERIGPVDILIIPLGRVLSCKEVQKIISQIEPKVVIPVQSIGKESKTKLEEFLKEMGAKNVEPRKQAVLRKKELKEDGAEIIVLEV